MGQGTVTTQSHGQSFIIKRPRLTRLLDESDARIILLVAPAGYGKTTLAREWAAMTRQPVAWYRATAASADVGALAPGLAAVLDAATGEGGFAAVERVAALASIHQRPESLARALVASRQSWPPRLLVGIDDYQEIVSSAAAEEFLGALVSLLPARFIITTRLSPAWLTTRHAVYGEAVQLGASDLALTEAEVSQIFDAASLPVPGRSLLSVARGWPAVIGLAARTGRRALPTDALPRRLYEFLASELLESTSDTTQIALTTLAVSGTTDPDLAVELLGPDATTAFFEAERRGLLTFEDSGRLTLHPLLSELLIRNHRKQKATDLASSFERTAHTLLSLKRWDECLAIAESLESSQFIIDALEESLYELLSNGRTATVLRWVHLARQRDIDDPIVDLAEGEAVMRRGDYDKALALGTRSANRSSGEILPRAQLLAARAASFADKRATARDWFIAAEKSATTRELRADATWGRFVVQMEDEAVDVEKVLRLFAEASDGSVDNELRLSQGRSLVGLLNGSVHEALEATRAGLALVPRARDPLVRLSSLNGHAWTLGLAGFYEEALEASERMLEEAESLAVDFALSHVLVSKARALMGLRKFGAARRALGELVALAERDPSPWIAANVAMQQARLCISLGDLDRAAEHLSRQVDVRLPHGTRAEYAGYRALVEAARDRQQDAWRWLGSAPNSSHVEAHAIALVTESILGIETGAEGFPDTALRPLKSALASGHHDAIVIACRACPELARRVVLHSSLSQVLYEILIRSRDTAIARTAGLQIPRTERRADLLTPREREVYELMAQGRTNRQIAKTLFISESTTKVHVRHIFEKLGVRSRIEAIRALQPE